MTLTIYGKREKVLVIREEEGVQRVYGVNLCSAEHSYTSPVYYLRQNDVVYVEPNNVRARQATVNGNNVRSTSFLDFVGFAADYHCRIGL